jgi:hypothetical protein
MTSPSGCAAVIASPTTSDTAALTADAGVTTVLLLLPLPLQHRSRQ